MRQRSPRWLRHHRLFVGELAVPATLGTSGGIGHFGDGESTYSFGGQQFLCRGNDPVLSVGFGLSVAVFTDAYSTSR